MYLNKFYHQTAYSACDHKRHQYSFKLDQVSQARFVPISDLGLVKCRSYFRLDIRNLLVFFLLNTIKV